MRGWQLKSVGFTPWLPLCLGVGSAKIVGLLRLVGQDQSSFALLCLVLMPFPAGISGL